MNAFILLGWILFLFCFGIFSLIMDHITTPKEITYSQPLQKQQSDLTWHDDYANDDGSSYSTDTVGNNLDDSLFDL